MEQEGLTERAGGRQRPAELVAWCPARRLPYDRHTVGTVIVATGRTGWLPGGHERASSSSATEDRMRVSAWTFSMR